MTEFPSLGHPLGAPRARVGLASSHPCSAFLLIPLLSSPDLRVDPGPSRHGVVPPLWEGEWGPGLGQSSRFSGPTLSLNSPAASLSLKCSRAVLTTAQACLWPLPPTWARVASDGIRPFGGTCRVCRGVNENQRQLQMRLSSVTFSRKGLGSGEAAAPMLPRPRAASPSPGAE